MKGISCKEFADFLGDYFSGELSDAQRAVFDRHMALCSDCRNYLDTYRQTLELEGELKADDEQVPSPEIPEDLVTAILASRHR